MLFPRSPMPAGISLVLCILLPWNVANSADMDILPGILKDLGLPDEDLLPYESYKHRLENKTLRCKQIPRDIVSLRTIKGHCRVTAIEIHTKNLTGHLSKEIRHLTMLRMINLRSNRLTGPIFDLGALISLQVLDLSGNLLSGPIPNLPDSLVQIFLSNNNLTGRVPSLGKFEKLQQLYLAGNQLSGHIPRELGGMRKLQKLSFARNQLKGSIPGDLCKGGLRSVSLAYNRLNGTISEEVIWNCTALQKLNLGHNFLTGEIPPAPLMQDTSFRLKQLRLNDNQLEGPIPSLEKLEKLVELSLAGNKLTGSIRALALGMPSLQTLDLSRNLLEGVIPNLRNLTALKHLSLEHNFFSGPFPDTFCHMALVSLHLNYNHFSGELPDCFEWSSSFRNLMVLFLGNNHFSGPLPDLTSLEHLAVVTLHMNAFSGPLPTLATNVSVATFHDNELSGAIPNMKLRKRCIDNERFYLRGLTCKRIGKKLKQRRLRCEEIATKYHKDPGALLANCPRTCDACWKSELWPSITLHSNRLSGEVPSQMSADRSVEVRALAVMGNMLGVGEELNATWIHDEEEQEFLYNSRASFTSERMIVIQFSVLVIIGWPLKRWIESALRIKHANAVGRKLMKSYVKVLRITSGIAAFSVFILPMYFCSSRWETNVRQT